MNIFIQGQQTIRPEAAVILYNGGASTQTAAILHQIKEDGTLSCGKHLDWGMLEEIFRSRNGKNSLTWLPEKVLAMKSNAILWFEQSRKHAIYFDTKEDKRKQLGTYSGREIIWPPLLFLIRNGQLFCWALRSNRRPTPETQIYVAPLTHINEAQGNVCLPSGIKLSQGVSPLENMQLISNHFYDGIFGHGTGSMRQINHPGGHDGFWIEYLQKQPEKFPVNLLKRTKHKLKDILK